MNIEKQDVIVIVADTSTKRNELYNKAFALYVASPGKNRTQEFNLNRSGFSESNLKTVIYELKKLHKITESDIKSYLNSLNEELQEDKSFEEKVSAAIIALEEPLKTKVLLPFKMLTELLPDQEISNELRIFLDEENTFKTFEKIYPELSEALNNLDTYDVAILFKEHTSALEYPAEFKEELEALKKIDFIETIVDPSDTKMDTEALNQTINLFQTAPDEVKSEIRFRNEFPFLSDPNIPDELKILVTDKFNHYYAFCNAHDELFTRVVLPLLEGKKPEDAEQIQNDEIFSIAKKAIGDFEMDQLIYDEFDHYKKEAKVLGLHPIFLQRKLKQSVEEMSTGDAATRATNLANYIRRDKSKAKNATTDSDRIKYESKVQVWDAELALINTKLGIVNDHK